jgi:cell division septal protein FtsQ
MKKKKSLRKKQRIRKRKSFFENDIIYGLTVFLFFTFISFYFFVFNPFFQINSIEIYNSTNINEDSLHRYVEKKVAKENFLFTSRSIFFVSEKNIREDILSQTSIIKDISIEKIFPSKIKLILEEREPIAVWCKKKNMEFCFYIDKEGIAFQKIKNTEKMLLPIIMEKEFVLGEKVIEEDFLKNIFFLRNELHKLNIEIRYFNLSKKNTIEVSLKDSWDVLFSLNNYKEEVKNLKFILEKMNQENIKKLNYIDLRFGDRIYYK